MKLLKDITTPRLVIRSWRISDREFTLSIWGDRDNGRYMSDPARENADEKYLACVDAMEDDPDGYFMTAELRETGTPVGTCCAFPEGDNFDIGYCIHKSRWREGLGTEMACALRQWIRDRGGRSVTAEVADDNLASVTLLRGLGFTEFKKTRYKKWGEDTYFDAHYYKLDLT